MKTSTMNQTVDKKKYRYGSSVKLNDEAFKALTEYCGDSIKMSPLVSKILLKVLKEADEKGKPDILNW